MPFGNVNVDYAPCKSVRALKAAADYMLGRRKEQIESGVKKTSEELYTALGCNRDNFANGILVTRKLNGKSYSKHKENTILAHKMSISFHPDDNVKYKDAYKIAEDFAEHFIHSKGFEVLFAVHTDTPHVHVHFLISNCNMVTGKSYRRSQRDLYEMSEYFGITSGNLLAVEPLYPTIVDFFGDGKRQSALRESETGNDVSIFASFYKFVFANHAYVSHTAGYTLGDVIIAKV